MRSLRLTRIGWSLARPSSQLKAISVLLEDLLLKAEHSLIDQSLHSRMGRRRLLSPG